MDISVFCNLLYSEMIKLGAPEAKVARYIDNLKKNLTESDVADVTENDIPRYAVVCINSMKGNPHARSSENTSDLAQKQAETSYEAHPSSVPEEVQVTDTDEYIEYEISNTAFEKRSSSKFVLVTIASSPLWLIAAVLFILPFAALFLLEIAIITALIALLAVCAALGTAAALTGIIYGVIQMFSSPAAGLYEIGFGVIIGGVALVCGILLYNGAVRLMPYVMKKSVRLLKFTFSKVMPLLSEYKRRLTK